jgi:hypothetical protein
VVFKRAAGLNVSGGVSCGCDDVTIELHNHHTVNHINSHKLESIY